MNDNIMPEIEINHFCPVCWQRGLSIDKWYITKLMFVCSECGFVVDRRG